jgi:hypothetical protein
MFRKHFRLAANADGGKSMVGNNKQKNPKNSNHSYLNKLKVILFARWVFFVCYIFFLFTSILLRRRFYQFTEEKVMTN